MSADLGATAQEAVSPAAAAAAAAPAFAEALAESDPPSKRARLDEAGHHAADVSAGANGSAESATQESLRRMLDPDRAPSDTATRTTLHFPAAAGISLDAEALATSTVVSDGSGRADLTWPTLSPFPMSAGDDWNYDGARVLAPMVRIGTLPMRMLAVEMGATMVYSEELIAKKLRHCTRHQRQAGDKVFVDFVPSRGGAPSSIGSAATASAAAAAAPSQPVAPVELNSSFVQSSASADDAPPGAAAAPKRSQPVHNANLKSPAALTTFPGERLVVQLGAANAEDALAAAQVVANDCRAIDINSGCPKHFSLQGGMGAALLSKPERAADILSTLRRNINLPITIKIRLLHTDAESVELVRRLERMGVSAIALHARHIEDRPRHRALRFRVKVVAESLNVPLLYNGDCFYAHDLEDALASTGARGVMVARGAMWNASVFRRPSVDPETGAKKHDMLPVAEVVRRYVSIAGEVDGHVFSNTKYAVLEMLKGQVGSSDLFKSLTRCKTREDLQAALGTMEKYPELTGEYRAPVQLEERPGAAAGAKAGAECHAVPAELVLAPSPSAGTAAAAGNGLPSVPIRPARPQNNRERKIEAKQKRKNREGRAQDLLLQQQAQQQEPPQQPAAQPAPAAADAEPANAPMSDVIVAPVAP